MFLHRRDEVDETACRGEENLAFAVNDIFLEVIGDGFRCAEIFHCHRNGDSHLFAEMEKMVDGAAGGEDNRGEIRNVYLLLAEFLGRQSFNFDKLTEYKLYIVFAGNVVVGRFVGTWFGLGDKNFLYHS